MSNPNEDKPKKTGAGILGWRPWPWKNDDPPVEPAYLQAYAPRAAKAAAGRGDSINEPAARERPIPFNQRFPDAQQRPALAADKGAPALSGKPGNVYPAQVNAPYVPPENPRHYVPGPAGGAQIRHGNVPASNAYAAAAVKQSHAIHGAGNQGHRGAGMPNPRAEHNALGKRSAKDFICRRNRSAVAAFGDVRPQERQISFGEGSIQYWVSQIPHYDCSKPLTPDVSLALEDLEFFIRELVRSGKKTTVQVTTECAWTGGVY